MTKKTPKDTQQDVQRQRQLWTQEAAHCATWHLTLRQIYDIEMLINGGFHPLTQFLGRKDYESVLSAMRLSDGRLWPIPIMLDVEETFAESLETQQVVSLCNRENLPIALITVEEIWKPDLHHEARCVYGTDDESHVGVKNLLDNAHPVYISGPMRTINPPRHQNFLSYRHTPGQLKQWFKDQGWTDIVAFQTRNPMHRAHVELLLQTQKNHSGTLIHPVVGLSRPGDINYPTRVQCYKHIVQRMEPNPVKLSLLPLAMRMAGPREAVWHGLIRKNHGCTHMIIGRDHAGPGKSSKGEPFYDQYEAIDLFREHSEEIGVQPVAFPNMVYNRRTQNYVPEDKCPKEDKCTLSGTELRETLIRGGEIPEWFTFPEITAILRRSYPPLPERGLTIFFTGLSGSGKSTLARALRPRLLEFNERPVLLLDGDNVRMHLSKELTFSRKDRSLNVRRMGFVASLITQSRGIAICAPIAPYDDDRRYNRALITRSGSYVQIYVSTPLEVCQQRDPKGFYKKARSTNMQFTGVDDPYEEPRDSEIRINTADHPVDECVGMILDKLRELGHLGSASMH